MGVAHTLRAAEASVTKSMFGITGFRLPPEPFSYCDPQPACNCNACYRIPDLVHVHKYPFCFVSLAQGLT